VDIVYQADKAWLLDIQRKLYTWSRSTPDDAWRDMWKWVTHPQNLRLAWRRVASNRGARSSGVDKPDYAYPARESPVHNERCTPGSGTEVGETGGGNPDSGASPPRSLRDKEDRSAMEARP
jgi:hypothetical protein